MENKDDSVKESQEISLGLKLVLPRKAFDLLGGLRTNISDKLSPELQEDMSKFNSATLNLLKEELGIEVDFDFNHKNSEDIPDNENTSKANPG